MYILGAQLPAFVDPRIELFPDRVWDDYFKVSQGRKGWDETLDRWDAGVVILHPDWAGDLLAVIGHAPDWRLLARSRLMSCLRKGRSLA